MVLQPFLICVSAISPNAVGCVETVDLAGSVFAEIVWSSIGVSDSWKGKII